MNEISKTPAATRGAANRGPTTRVRLFATDCIAMALGRSSGVTEFAAIAMLAGPANMNETPIMKATASSPFAVSQPPPLDTASTPQATATPR